MKLNLDVKPKEWVQLAAFVLVIYIIMCGKAEEAVKFVAHWFGK